VERRTHVSLEFAALSPEPRTIIIGTRGSALAVWQAEHVAARLRDAAAGLATVLERIKTSGDRIQDVPLAQVGGKALFVKEIEEALLEGRVDLAVHSMKDVPAEIPAGLAIAAVLAREDPSDVLLSRSGAGLDDLPPGSRIGTGSLRRRAQLLHRRPDVTVLPLRGNLDTRIRKLTAEGLDGIVLALAGVRRLGLEHLVTEALSPDVVLPAVGQGALGVEIRDQRAGSSGQRAGDSLPRSMADAPMGFPAFRIAHSNVASLVRGLDHDGSHRAVRAERALLRRLGGSCQVPVAGLATVQDGTIRLRGLVAGLDGDRVIRAEACGPADHPEAVGSRVAEDLLARGAGEILRAISGAGR
jgi:hydroxymethylbilane synthase